MDNLKTLSCPSCGANLELASGTKQFSCEYCGNTHVVLDIVSEESSSQAHDKTALAQGRLMAFFGFSKEDLRYNQEGKLSPRQKERFFMEGLMSFTLFLVGGLISAFAILVWVPVNQPAQCASMSVITFVIIGLIQCALLIRPVATGVVQSEVGSLGKSPYPTLKPVFFIGRESFLAKGNPFTALEWNVPYKVYYTSVRRTILSIEILNS